MKMPLLLLALFLFATSARADFSWTDTPGKHLELTYGDKPVARYVYEAIDESSPARRDETYKPFCHLYMYQWEHYGNLLTKGPGGKFPHHRGVYYGFNQISYTDAAGKKHEKVDVWHCRKAHQVHRRFTEQEASADAASFTSEIDWVGDDGVPFATESRTMRFSLNGPDVIVDFESTLSPQIAELKLDGDPQHAGFHFRAHNEVNDKTSNATYYLRPVSGIGQPGVAINWSDKADNDQTRDLPWKAMCITLRETQVTISYLDHPKNPKPARASERQYGRFGTYFATTVKKEKPLTVRYRLVVHPGEYKDAAEVEKLSQAFLKEKP